MDVSRIFVTGLGAVSPAGWNVAALREALRRGEPLPVEGLDRPGWEKPLRARVVPAPATRPDFLSHPRLRRSSPITHYAAAAALEAMGGMRSGPETIDRLGLVVCVQAGCVRYSCRFLDVTIKDPTTASPLLFPETVYAAPASHVAALLGNVSLASSLVGDPGAFIEGMALAVQWLEEERVNACLVIGAEETNWILADALRHLDRDAIITAGAGALCLSRNPEAQMRVELAAITDAHTYSARHTRMQAAGAMRAQLGGGTPADLLCDGLADSPRVDAPELAAWRDWPGERFSPKRIFGEGLMASAAWQCVAACDALANGRFNSGKCQPRRLQPAGHRRAIRARGCRHFPGVCRRRGGQNPVMSSRVILVTGANGGLGQAIARTFVQESPANFVWLGIRNGRERADDLARENPGRCACVSLDVTAPASWSQALEEILARHGRLDVLVNNAGSHEDALLANMPPDSWSRVLATNLDSVFHGCQAVVKTMISQHSGRIVNISSLSALLAPAGQANYAAAKAGVVALTQSLAKEVARIGITVNAVCPGFVETEALARMAGDEKKAAQMRIPLRRFRPAGRSGRRRALPREPRSQLHHRLDS